MLINGSRAGLKRNFIDFWVFGARQDDGWNLLHFLNIICE